ncbi:MAG: gliding motility-associated C-terminal domain-containing protein [Reichenbachiella sp.]|uniref:T9SS type B sorting domain-containing protein n=1 Tax=Reichenbachiella sp. TaxID=2184521 RepID=UPI003262FF15
MKKLFFVFLAVVLSNLHALGFHIVGGEIELVHIDGFRYNLNLIQYFDRAQNSNPGPDFSAVVYIFRNSDHSLIRTETLIQASDVEVEYSNPECAIGSLQTSRVFYTAEITLEPEIFNEEEGYYVVWERCCRNTSISNIVNPGSQGMTYTLDFPPVVKDGKTFINSSPQLFPPLSDYACVNQTYYTDFAGEDPDGDSIAYSLQLPYNSTSQTALPIPQPKPFIELIYANGTSLENIIPGNPSLNITSEGYLTVKPSFTGLFVFSVLVEEFRNKEKIGELRRDFQMLVLDGCDPPTPPNAQVRLPGETEYYNEVDIINYSAAEEKCFEYLVVDNAGENVTLTAVGVNFDQNIEGSDIFDFTSGPINEDGDTLRVEVCIADCPYLQNEPYIIDLIASDNACPLPQRDTVRMIFNIEAPPNSDPYYDSPSSGATLIRSQPEGLSVALDELLIGKDDDLDSLRFYFYADGYDPEDYGMSLDTLLDEEGEKRVNFNWNTDCQAYSFGDKNTFELGIVLEDYDTCSFDNGDTLFYDLTVELPPNSSPEITGANAVYNREIKGLVSFDLSTTDDDGDQISLRAIGDGFDLGGRGITFEDSDGVGSIDSPFSWDLSCDNLNISRTTSYTIFFISDDQDYCQETNSDTLEVQFNIVVPENSKPVFEVEEFYSLNINEEFELDVVATDANNNDLLTLDLLSVNSAPPSAGFSFERRSTGNGRVTSKLVWTPECSLLGDNFSSENYVVDFFVFDDNCPNPESEAITVTFEVSELEVNYNNFSPPNAFTPNGDGRNDTYTLNNLTDNDYNLPPDNCGDQFQSIVIFDRAGGKVFQSANREFVWTGEGADTGTYFYYIDYLNNDFKGTITLVR